MRYVLAAGVTLFVVLVAVFAIINAQDLSPAELARRCDACAPAWTGYQEDIKAIGARPVAEWRGEPVSAQFTGGEARVTMALAPPWDSREAALPLLLKDPEGQIHRHATTEGAGAHRIYIFRDIASPGANAPPWLELQYPHTRRRLYLDASGHWNADQPPTS